MALLAAALCVLLCGGAVAVAASALRRERLALWLGARTAVVGCAIGAFAALSAVAAGGSSEIELPWAFPAGSLRFGIDPLSALFLLPVFGLGLFVSLYAGAYFRESVDRKRRLGPTMLFLAVLIAAMAAIVLARAPYCLVFAWEMMTLSGFMLVGFDHDDEAVRRASLQYVVVSHVATMALLAFVFIVAGGDPSYDLGRPGGGAAPHAGLLFALSLVAFGTKAGFVPLHFWLPRAHPAAPSPVSSLMSGAIVKTALYAFLRGLTLLGPPPPLFGHVVLGLGALGALAGILFALAQRDVKRLLAYSTVENVGIALLGVGVGLLGVARDRPAIAVLGFAGAILHGLHHAAMKGLLFLCAGSVLHATHARTIEAQGGLWKRMPVTGATFLVGALSISGLPGLCGFASEFLIYTALLKGGLELAGLDAVSALGGVPALALVGGLAAAAFTKVFGLVFLGEPRTDAAAHAHEAPLGMRAPMVGLAALCLALGLLPTITVPAVLPAAALLARVEPEQARALAGPTLEALRWVTIFCGIFLGIAAALAALRAWLLSGREVEAGRGTWGCGYGAPSPRMQYTGHSFAHPLLRIAAPFLHARTTGRPPIGNFPAAAERGLTIDDPAEAAAMRLLGHVELRLRRLRWLQQGPVQLYILYIAIALLGVVAWTSMARGDVAWGVPPRQEGGR